jgi:hypothetical protein
MTLKIDNTQNTSTTSKQQPASTTAKVIKVLIPAGLIGLWTCYAVQSYRYISLMGSLPWAYTASVLSTTVHVCCVYTLLSDKHPDSTNP